MILFQCFLSLYMTCFILDNRVISVYSYQIPFIVMRLDSSYFDMIYLK